jgi:hypothetical protein
MGVTPSLSLRERHPMGCIPLTPHLIFRVFRKFPGYLHIEYHIIGGMPWRRGQRHLLL